jgi:hypothetical protein
MKIQDLFRAMLDQMDGMEHTTGNPSNALDSVEGGLVPVVADNTDASEQSTMIPPLQASLELLKKATGVDNAYDEKGGCGCEEQPCGCEGGSEDYAEEDGLGDITRLAGIPAITIVQADQTPL